MTDKQNILEIDNIEYHFTDGDFFETEKQARKLLNFADGLIEVKMIETDEGKQPDFEFHLGAVLGNLSGANFDSIRDFIFGKYVVRYTVHGAALVILRIWHHYESSRGST